MCGQVCGGEGWSDSHDRSSHSADLTLLQKGHIWSFERWRHSQRQLCVPNSYSVSVPPPTPHPMLRQWHVKDSDHSAKTQSGLTLLLSGHRAGTCLETSSHTTCQGTFSHSCLSSQSHWTDPGIKSRISVRKLISTLKKKKCRCGMNGHWKRVWRDFYSLKSSLFLVWKLSAVLAVVWSSSCIRRRPCKYSARWTPYGSVKESVWIIPKSNKARHPYAVPGYFVWEPVILGCSLEICQPLKSN